MAFVPNPLSLSVPEPAFEAWLRESGYLEILDERTSSSSAASAASVANPYPPPSSSVGNPRRSSTVFASTAGDSNPLDSLFSFLRTLASLLALNPFAKLVPEDFSAPTPSWTLEFVGAGAASYSWPAGPAQARMRVHENVRRYARNYAFLAVLIFACCLYRMPISLLGLVSSLLLWELVRLCSRRWELEQRWPGLRQVLVRIAQIASAVVLYECNLQLALVCAISFSYAVMILHASLRKLTPLKQSVGANRSKRFPQKKAQLAPK